MDNNREPFLQRLPASAKRKSRWLILLSSFPLFGMMAAFGIAPDTSIESFPVQQVVLGLTLPEIHPSEDTHMTFWRQERIQRGDTIASLLSRLEVNNRDVVSFLRDARNVKTMHQLVPGRIVHVQTGTAGELLWLRYFPGGSEQLSMEKSRDGFTVTEQPAQLETHVQMKSGVINSSLFAAVDSAGVPESVALQIVEILSSDIDFHRDLRKGDRFTVVYDSLYIN